MAVGADMTATCCPLSSNDGYSADAFAAKVRRARKAHVCFECREAIAPGDKYEYASGVWDGEPRAYKSCLSCVEIRDHFACEGYMIGELWNDLEQNFFPDMKAGGPCMEGLSAAAKGILFERRTAWLLDSDMDERTVFPRIKEVREPLYSTVETPSAAFYFTTDIPKDTP